MLNQRLVYGFFTILFLIFAFPSKANVIQDFEVKEYVTQDGTLAIVVLDSVKQADKSIEGTFRFIINGFDHSLSFEQGVAVFPQVLSKSSFVFLKHKVNGNKEVGKYYYILKNEKGLKTIELNGLTLLLIPVLILFIAYVFKRFMFVFVLLALVFLYFYFTQGLDLGPFIDHIFFSLKKLVF